RRDMHSGFNLLGFSVLEGHRMPRKATPAHLRVLHGNPSNLPPMPNEPEGVGVLWAPPAWFDDDQREQWHYAIENAPPGLLSATDRETLAIWCCASVEYAKAVQHVRAHGAVMKSKGGVMMHNPHATTMNKQAAMMLRCGGEMGFSPASRAALGKAAADGVP